jgi:rhodanese-related sulfurtransferase
MGFFDFGDKGNKVKRISPAEVKSLLATPEKGILLDVRTPAEHRQIRIPGSILIPLNMIASGAPEMLKDKNKPVYVYCQSGARSSSAARTLSSMGYTEVYDLGGIMAWPYETQRG